MQICLCICMHVGRYVACACEGTRGVGVPRVRVRSSCELLIGFFTIALHSQPISTSEPIFTIFPVCQVNTWVTVNSAVVQPSALSFFRAHFLLKLVAIEHNSWQPPFTSSPPQHQLFTNVASNRSSLIVAGSPNIMHSSQDFPTLCWCY